MTDAPYRELIRADPPSGPALGDSRAQVLAVLQRAGEPLGVNDVASRVGLHANTTRFHLDGLVEQGLAHRGNEQRDAPGRPRALYAVTAAGRPVGRRSYRLLAGILTSYVATHTDDPEQAAVAAGETWGHLLTGPPPRARRADAAVGVLVDVLDDIGFAPEAVTVGRERRILLHRCPFREMAQAAHGAVVCAVHLGLMRGVLAGQGAPVQARRLDPFVEPDLCVARLGAPARTAKRRAG